jgi:hypothetical protein
MKPEMKTRIGPIVIVIQNKRLRKMGSTKRMHNRERSDVMRNDPQRAQLIGGL